MSLITYERIQELEADLKRAKEWADMRTEEVARLEARLAQLGETAEAIERAKTTPRVRELLDEYENRDGGQPGGASIGELAPEAIAALRAVLGLHCSDAGDCAECGVDTGENPIPWPCNTVRVIATALEAK